MKSKKINKYVAPLSLIIVLYVGVYFGYIYPISRLHQLQTKEWATTLIENTILGVKDHSYLHKIHQSKIDDISFYYNYFFFHTRKVHELFLFG